jgi:hypothetical protein
MTEGSPDTSRVSLATVAHVVWTRRLAVAAILVACTLLGALYAYAFGNRHRGQAALLTTTITLSDFKKSWTPLFDREQFLGWLAKRNVLSETELADLGTRIRRSDGPIDWVSPLFAVTKVDVRDLTEPPKDAGAFVGVLITVDHRQAEVAKALVLATSDYVRNTLVDGRVNEMSLLRLMDARRELAKLQARIVSRNFELQVLDKKRTELVAIRSRYPDVAKLEGRQVVSVDNEGARFLSPVVQLVGIESQMATIRERIALDERMVEKTEFEIDYYARIRSGRAPGNGALAIVDGLRRIRADVLQGKDGTQSAIREALAGIDGDIEQLQLLTGAGIHLNGDPISDDAWEKRRRQIIVFAAVAVGVLLAILYALVAQWWHVNRDQVTRA